MNFYTLLVLSIGPGIFWMWFFYRKDRLEPEPKRLVIMIFFWGALAVIPAYIVEVFLGGIHPVLSVNNKLGIFVGIVVFAPIVEEIIKFLVVHGFIYRNAEFDEPMDGIIYAAAAALGFASAENFLYVFGAHNSAVSSLYSSESNSVLGAVLNISILRAFLSVPGHALFSAIWGFSLGWAKFMHNKRAAQKLVLMGLLVSILSHGLFNFLCVMNVVGCLGLLIFMKIAWSSVQGKIDRALANSPHTIPK